MPYGSGHAVRQAMTYAKPWQRYVIAGAMIAGGVGLAAFGRLSGVVLAALGALLLWRMLRYRFQSRRPVQPAGDTEGSKPQR